jgi:hypothetical protein
MKKWLSTFAALNGGVGGKVRTGGPPIIRQICAACKPAEGKVPAHHADRLKLVAAAGMNRLLAASSGLSEVEAYR